MARQRERRLRAALTRDGEDSAGTTAIRPVSSCSNADNWMRRRGECEGGGLAREGKEMGEGAKRRVLEAAAPILKGFGGVEQRGLGWHHAVRRWGMGGQHCGRVAQSASNGSRPVGAGTAARTCHMAGPNRGGRWLTGGSGATVMGGGGQTV
jgi:hypothetical protein